MEYKLNPVKYLNGDEGNYLTVVADADLLACNAAVAQLDKASGTSFSSRWKDTEFTASSLTHITNSLGQNRAEATMSIGKPWWKIRTTLHMTLLNGLLHPGVNDNDRTDLLSAFHHIGVRRLPPEALETIVESVERICGRNRDGVSTCAMLSQLAGGLIPLISQFPEPLQQRLIYCANKMAQFDDSRTAACVAAYVVPSIMTLSNPAFQHQMLSIARQTGEFDCTSVRKRTAQSLRNILPYLNGDVADRAAEIAMAIENDKTTASEMYDRRAARRDAREAAEAKYDRRPTA